MNNVSTLVPTKASTDAEAAANPKAYAEPSEPKGMMSGAAVIHARAFPKSPAHRLCSHSDQGKVSHAHDAAVTTEVRGALACGEGKDLARIRVVTACLTSHEA